MPLARPSTIRVLATPDDGEWSTFVVSEIRHLPYTVTTDAAERPVAQARPPSAVILVWSTHTTASVQVNREVGEWDRRRVPIHVLNVDASEVLAYMTELSASVHKIDNSSTGSLEPWLRQSVLGLEVDESTSHLTKDLTFLEAAAIYGSSLRSRLGTVEVIGQEEPVELEELYLPLELESSGLGAQPGGDLIEILQRPSRQRVFVVGSPGSGKSTLLDYTAFHLTGNSINPGVPILLRATDLVSSGYGSIVEYAQLVIKGCVARGGREVSDLLVNSDEFGDGNTFLLIDGIDELKRNDRTRMRQLLRTFETEFPDASIAVTSRPSGNEPGLWDDYRMLAVRPLAPVSARSYVERFAPAEYGSRLLELLEGSEHLRELAQVPFMLALMCSYRGEGEDLPLRRAALIRACVSSLMRRRPLNPEVGLDYAAMERCYTSVSDRLFRLNSAGGHGEGEFLLAIQAFLTDWPGWNKYGHQGPSTLDRAALTLEELLDRTGLLQRNGDYIDFVHRSVWEFFVAAALVDRGVGAVDDVAGAPAWEEPIRLALGLLPEDVAREILRRLWTRNPSLALRGASECSFDSHDLLQELLAVLPAGEAAALVRDLRTMMADAATHDHAERVVLDTLQVLLPEARSCETIYEGLVLLLEIRSRTDEADDLIDRIFDFHSASSRLMALEEGGQPGARFVVAPPGDLMMGSDSPGRSVDERPAHPVRLSQFSIARFQVTNAARAFFPFEIGLENDHRSREDDSPLIGVTWYEATVFALWFGCRLPTEAEWEYACRSGGIDDERLANESLMHEYAWYAANAGNETHPVGELCANSWGLFDVLGNVREWCSDWFDTAYYSACLALGEVEDPIGPARGSYRVLRGGCFDWNTANLVPTYRNSNLPNNRGFQNGMRLVMGFPPRLRERLRLEPSSGTSGQRTESEDR